MKGFWAAEARLGAAARSSRDASETPMKWRRARIEGTLPVASGRSSASAAILRSGMRVALAQIDPTVGDIDGNAAKIAEWIGRARAEGADLAIFPELCLPGYPAEDLYLKRHFVEANRRAVEELAAEASGLTALVGFAEPVAGGGDFRHAHNSLAVLADGEVRSVYRKNRLPNYSVFDEQRYFVPGTEPATIEVAGTQVGLTICEDCWVEGPPASTEAAAGAQLIANPSASPYHRGKGREREEMFAERARAYGAHFAFCNLVGGQDELVFDGQSFVDRPRRRGRSPAPPSSRRSCWSARSPRPQPGPARRAAAGPRRGLRGARPRPARLRRQERLPPRRRRPLGRDRLRPGGAARGGRGRPASRSAAW